MLHQSVETLLTHFSHSTAGEAAAALNRKHFLVRALKVDFSSRWVVIAGCRAAAEWTATGQHFLSVVLLSWGHHRSSSSPRLSAFVGVLSRLWSRSGARPSPRPLKLPAHYRSDSSARSSVGWTKGRINPAQPLCVKDPSKALSLNSLRPHRSANQHFYLSTFLSLRRTTSAQKQRRKKNSLKQKGKDML